MTLEAKSGTARSFMEHTQINGNNDLCPIKMDVRPFDISKVLPPWKDILTKEVERLKANADVLAFGIAGSFAYEDTWSHSDIDLEVILKGDREFNVLNTEQGKISVDFGLFGGNDLKRIPYETRPIYDPNGLMTKELSSRDLNDELSRAIQEGLAECGDLLKRAEEALSVDPKSTAVFLHLFAWGMSTVLTVAAGDNRTVKRTCSRLERAMRKRGREDFLRRCEQLYGFPKTLEHVQELLSHLQEGYREIWGFFKGKKVGPRYMIQQPDSEAWFHNRIEPVYWNDPRDLVWIVYIEFPFVTSFLFRNLTSLENLPPDMFRQSETFQEAPAKWINRHLKCLELLDVKSSESMLSAASALMDDARQFVGRRLYVR